MIDFVHTLSLKLRKGSFFTCQLAIQMEAARSLSPFISSVYDHSYDTFIVLGDKAVAAALISDGARDWNREHETIRV